MGRGALGVAEEGGAVDEGGERERLLAAASSECPAESLYNERAVIDTLEWPEDVGLMYV